MVVLIDEKKNIIYFFKTYFLTKRYKYKYLSKEINNNQTFYSINLVLMFFLK